MEVGFNQVITIIKISVRYLIVNKGKNSHLVVLLD